jgi:hypothetical protein
MLCRKGWDGDGYVCSGGMADESMSGGAGAGAGTSITG